MNLNPLWAPTRRLPRYSVTPPPAYTDHHNDRQPGNNHGLRRFGSVHLPFRGRPATTYRDERQLRPSEPSHHTPRQSKRRSVPARGLADDPRQQHLERRYSTSNSAHEARSNRPVADRRRYPDTDHYADVPYQCEVGGCLEEQLPREMYCKSHKCLSDGCCDVRTVDSRYCLAHRCRSCSRQVQDESRYCAEHKCGVGSCTRRKKRDQDWCSGHGCDETGCPLACIIGSDYCRDHACAAGHCTSKVLRYGSRLGNYCCCHTCIEEGCLLRSAHGGAFCEEHACKVRGCPNPRYWDDERGEEMEHECCKFHTCGQRECFAPTAQVGVLCDLHAQAYSYSTMLQHDQAIKEKARDEKKRWEEDLEKGKDQGQGQDQSCSHGRCSSHRCDRWKAEHGLDDTPRRPRRSDKPPKVEDRPDRDSGRRSHHRSSRYQTLEIRILRVNR
ncbi:hypothetical protein F5Y17DRAFT_238719 [Xylariaceae sp. FL0594]|nr:hypothetical protein F5Y17DRAFT_238719 [Xylariaceae sp. FL0594]